MLERLWADAPAHGRVFIGALSDRQNYETRDAIVKAAVQEMDVFYTPALLVTEEGRPKTAFLSSRCLWVDLDEDPPLAVGEVLRRCILPPSFIVATGGGHHLYWLLEHWQSDVATVERANRLLMQDVDGDPCWDAVRLLRVPGSLTSKHAGFVVTVVWEDPSFRYSMADVLALERVGKKVRHRIRTGDARGYPSRSERDLAIVGSLLRAGISTDLIARLFEKHACGDRFREEGTRGLDYLALAAGKVTHDEEKERERTASSFEEAPEGLYYTAGKTRRQVATFNFIPDHLLEVVDEGGGQAIIGTVETPQGRWTDVVLPRAAFNSIRALQGELKAVAWQWLGSDKVIREYLPYLVAKLEDLGMPSTLATTTLGYCDAAPEPCYVFDGWTICADSLTEGRARPVVYVDRKQEHPHYCGAPQLSEGDRTDLKKRVAALLPRLNTPEVLWPALGWFVATPLKPRLRELGFKFPILNIYGTRGAGKTSLIQNVFMPLLGVCAAGGGPEVSYNADTTRFVMLALLGGSNCVPISFSEFREASVRALIRYVLLAYDSGKDPRGRADQTTVSYPLIAPFVIDGEDQVGDPAAYERTISVGLRPDTISEDSDCARAYTELTALPLTELAADLYQWCLRADTEALVAEATRIVHNVLPEPLPDRVRRNLTVVVVGLLAARHTGLAEAVEWEALRGPAKNAVANRGRTLVAAMWLIDVF